MRLGATNQKIEWLSKLVELVRPHFHEIELPAKLVEGLEVLAQEIVARNDPYAPVDESPAANRGFSPPSEVYRSDKETQLSEVAQAAPEASPEQHRAAADLYLVLEGIAGLERKRDANIVAISPRGASERTPVRLAGNFAGSFFAVPCLKSFVEGRHALTLSRSLTGFRGLYSTYFYRRLTGKPASALLTKRVVLERECEIGLCRVHFFQKQC